MNNAWDMPTRTEMLRRHIADSSIASALTILSEASEQDRTMRAYQHAMDVAVNSALLQFVSHITIEIARIDAAEKLRFDREMMRAPNLFIKDVPA